MAGNTVTARSGIAVDTQDLNQLAKYLRDANKQVHKDFRKGLQGIGNMVADEARVLAGSSKIASTIRVRTSNASVSILAGNERVPVAGLRELGNTGGSKSAAAAEGGKFRHPVFGNRDNWVKQDMHPYLFPSAQHNHEKAMNRLLEVIDKALADSGIRVE